MSLPCVSVCISGSKIMCVTGNHTGNILFGVQNSEPVGLVVIV